MKTDLGRLDEINEQDEASGQPGPDSGGQSGDTQGLSPVAEASDESVEELADEGQDVEAETVQGVEDAGDHPEEPVPDRRNWR
jgi:hypothetical protein